MLSIGEFSKICKVSTKTLRYYDAIGLLDPDKIDPENGYRLYSIGQLKKMLVIDRLKSYQFSLEEIKALLELETERSEDHLRSALERKSKEIQEKQNELAQILTQMSVHIRSIDEGISVMAYLGDIDVELVETRPMNILRIRQMMRSDDYAAGYGKYFFRLYEKIAAEKLTVMGTPMTIYHSPEYDPDGNDTEFAIPIKEALKDTKVLPEGLCAKCIHKGTYAELTSVYARLSEWIENEGFELARSPYEIYVSDPDQVRDPGDMVTEVYYPLRKKSSVDPIDFLHQRKIIRLNKKGYR